MFRSGDRAQLQGLRTDVSGLTRLIKVLGGQIMGLLESIKDVEDQTTVSIQNVAAKLGTLATQAADLVTQVTTLQGQIAAIGGDPALAQAILDLATAHKAQLDSLVTP